MADQNSIPSNLPIEEKKTGPTPLPPSPSIGGALSLASSVPSSNFPPKPVEKPIAPALVPSSVPTPSVPDSRPMKSYIRTMDSDIKSVQMGQAPRGTEKPLPTTTAESSSPSGSPGVAPVPTPKPA